MSGRVFQNIVLQFKDAVDTEIGVIDAEGTVIACTELSEIGSHWNELVSSINDAEESVIPVGGKTFKADCEVSERQRHALLAGGTLLYARQQNK